MVAAQRLPGWTLWLLPLLLIAGVIAAFALLDGPGLGDRNAPPVEELAIERTVLEPGKVRLTVRNDGSDALAVAQVHVNDAYVDFEPAGREIGRLETERLTIDYPWIEEQPLGIALVLSTGTTIEHEIAAAVETPDADPGFYGLMALLGVYVGIIPVALGMLWLPALRRVREHWMRIVMALTVGLLALLALDGTLEGLEIGREAAQSFGGIELVFLGAAASFLALSALEAHLRQRGERARTSGASPARLAFLTALGIGLHNLGEGIAIGSAYAVGALALGAFLVIGFAIHNTTEGLAIVAPLARSDPPLRTLVGLGLLAGAPAILGAWIGASAFNPSVAAFLFGIGVGAIVQVIVQLSPTLRDGTGRLLHPHSVGGIAAGVGLLYVTGLLISV